MAPQYYKIDWNNKANLEDAARKSSAHTDSLGIGELLGVEPSNVDGGADVEAPGVPRGLAEDGVAVVQEERGLTQFPLHLDLVPDLGSYGLLAAEDGRPGSRIKPKLQDRITQYSIEFMWKCCLEVAGFYILHFTPPMPAKAWGNKRGKNKRKRKKERKRGNKKIKFEKRILAENFMTYNRVHDRGGKGITRNIQFNIWRRNGKNKLCVVSKCEWKKYNKQIIKM